MNRFIRTTQPRPLRSGTKSRLGRTYYKFVQQPVAIDVTGGAFSSSLSASFGADVAGGAFKSSLSATIIDTAIYVTGGAFASTLDASFGLNVTGGSFKSTLTATLSEESYLFVTGGAFSSTLSGEVVGTTFMTVTGGAFKSTLEAYGGMSVTGGSFTSTLSSIVESPAAFSVTGGAFKSTLSSTIQDIGVFNVTGGSFYTRALNFDVTGGAFKSVLSATISGAQDPTVAYVLNIRTGESTRYTNYPFLHIMPIAGKFYGLRNGGLYLLEGGDDDGTAIAPSITTKETDFGAFQSKNVPYVYLNSDTATQLTSYVDGVEKATYASSFGGRKTHLGRGSKGRYWKFKIDDVQRLEGLEILPQGLQRRIK